MLGAGKSCLFVSLAVLAFAVLAVVGRLFWLPLLGRFLVVADSLRPSDAVVALAGGGPERIGHAAAIFHQGYAPRLVVTQMPVILPGVRATYAELARQEAIWQGVPEERILVAPGTVESTHDEALALREMAQERGWSALLVVTDPYHTRRARWIWRDTLRGSGVSVAVRPVEDAGYDPEAWWQSTDSLRETWTEYLKLALHLVGYR